MKHLTSAVRIGRRLVLLALVALCTVPIGQPRFGQIGSDAVGSAAGEARSCPAPSTSVLCGQETAAACSVPSCGKARAAAGDHETLHVHACYAPGTVLTADDFVIQNKSWHWPVDSTGNRYTITYSIHPSMTDGTLPGGLSCGEVRAAIEEALGLWARYAPLYFVELPDAGPAPGDASYSAHSYPNIRFSHHWIDGAQGALAHAYYPSSVANGLAGDVHFDSAESWAVAPGGVKYDLLEAAVHELGHALGLAHQPGPPSGVNANMNPYYAARFSGLGTATLQPDDIQGIRAIYGTGVGSINPLESLACEASIPACPAEATLRAAFDLPLPAEFKSLLRQAGPGNIMDGLRKFRDSILSKSPLGRELIRLYYEHSDELRRLSFADPKRGAKAVQMLVQTYPVIDAAVSNGGRVELDRDLYERGLGLIDDYRSAAGPDLSVALQSLRAVLEDSSRTVHGRVVIDLGVPVTRQASSETAVEGPGQKS